MSKGMKYMEHNLVTDDYLDEDFDIPIAGGMIIAFPYRNHNVSRILRGEMCAVVYSFPEPGRMHVEATSLYTNVLNDNVLSGFDKRYAIGKILGADGE